MSIDPVTTPELPPAPAAIPIPLQWRTRLVIGSACLHLSFVSSGNHLPFLGVLLVAIGFAMCWTDRTWRQSAQDVRWVTSLALALVVLWSGVLLNRTYVRDLHEHDDLGRWQFECQLGHSLDADARRGSRIFRTGFPFQGVLGVGPYVQPEGEHPVVDKGLPFRFDLFGPEWFRMGQLILWPNVVLLWILSYWLVERIPLSHRDWTGRVFLIAAAVLSVPGSSVALSAFLRL